MTLTWDGFTADTFTTALVLLGLAVLIISGAIVPELQKSTARAAGVRGNRITMWCTTCTVEHQHVPAARASVDRIPGGARRGRRWVATAVCESCGCQMVSQGLTAAGRRLALKAGAVDPAAEWLRLVAATEDRHRRY